MLCQLQRKSNRARLAVPVELKISPADNSKHISRHQPWGFGTRLFCLTKIQTLDEDMIMSIGWRHDPELRLPHHRGALALFAAAQAGASSALALANMAHEARRGSASGAEIDAPSAQQPTLRSPPAKRGSASDAAHPAWSSGDAAESPQSNLSDHAPELAVGFYNLGIQLSEIGGPKWRQKQPQLTSDLVTAFVTHELDILC